MAGLLDMLGGIFNGTQQGAPQQPSQPQPQPQAPQQQGGGMGDFLSALGPAIAMIDPRNQQLGAALMQMNMGRQQKREQKQQQNQTVSWLQKKGVGEEEAAFLASDPDALRAWWKQAATGNQPDWEITEIFNDEGQKIKAMVDKKTGKWNPIGGAEAKSKSNDVEYGLSPQTGVDAQGNPVLIQLGKNGTSIKTPLPEGVSLSKEPIKLDAGTHFVLLDPITRQPVGQIPKNLAGAEAEKVEGKAQGEARAAYSSVTSKMPGLEGVVKKLDDLSENATYTAAGQMLDLGRKQLGMDPRESAIARSEYIATVDNQVLPLLRDTFGAAFTQKEGDTLRATLGDPDKSPQEKQAVLKAFIEQKRRDVEALAVQSGQGVAPGGVPAAGTAPQQQNRLRFNPQTGELE